ncbi:Ankyrin-3 (ANK-3) (Ankyrin-G), partial [Durusdinium trenchii]
MLQKAQATLAREVRGAAGGAATLDEQGVERVLAQVYQGAAGCGAEALQGRELDKAADGSDRSNGSSSAAPTTTVDALVAWLQTSKVGPVCARVRGVEQGEEDAYQVLKYVAPIPDKIGSAPVKLLVPDDEASALAGGASESRKLLRPCGAQVWKLKSNWIKNWKKQFISVDQNGFVYSKQQSGQSQTLISLDKIVAVCPATPDDVGPKVKLKPQSFVMRTRDGRVHVFAVEGGHGPSSAAEWCRVIASYVLVHATQGNMSDERVAQFCEFGADVNMALDEGRRYPPLALALINGSRGLAEYLLRRGADPSCLLRWSFLMVDKVVKAVDVLNLLIATKKDLNVVGDDPHEWTLLHFLAYEGDLESVRRLIARVDVPTIRAVNTLGDCSLMLALKRHGRNPPDAIEKMCVALARSSDVERRDKWNDTVLHLAIKQGHLVLAKRVVELGARIETCDSHGDTSIHVAVKTGAFALAKWMVQRLHRDQRDAVLNIKDKLHGDTVFVLAIKLGQEELASFFLQHGADGAIPSDQWDLVSSCAKDSPLQVAVKMGMKSLPVLMVSQYCVERDLVALDTKGVPVLILALRRGLTDLLETLIDATQRLGTTSFLDVVTGRDGDSGLIVALERGMLLFACTLVDAGASVNLQNNQGWNVLHMCVDRMAGSSPSYRALVLDILRGLLVDHAADARLQCQSSNAETCLHMAVRGAVPEAVDLLLEHDATLADTCDSLGNSALNLAVIAGNQELVDLLVRKGRANVDIVNAEENSPLHLAVQSGSVDIVVGLLAEGAYPGVWDKAGMCPIHVAARADSDRIVAAFAKHCKMPGHLNLRTEDGHTAAMLCLLHGSQRSLHVLVDCDIDVNAKLPNSRKSLFHLAAADGIDLSRVSAIERRFMGSWDNDRSGQSVQSDPVADASSKGPEEGEEDDQRGPASVEQEEEETGDKDVDIDIQNLEYGDNDDDGIEG